MEIKKVYMKPIVEDIGKNLKINNRCFLRMFQEAANIESTDLGYGITQAVESQVTWVLLYWRIKIFDRISYGDEVSIKTWATFSKHLYSYRKFEMYFNDKLIAKAESKWVLLDAKNHKIMKLTDEIIKKYGEYDKEVFEDKFNDKISLPKNIDSSFSYKVMKRDLDINHHVNNINYLSIASEIIPDEVLENATTINIIYKKEIPFGQTLDLMVENGTVYIYNKETNTLHGAVTIK